MKQRWICPTCGKESAGRKQGSKTFPRKHDSEHGSPCPGINTEANLKVEIETPEDEDFDGSYEVTFRKGNATEKTVIRAVSMAHALIKAIRSEGDPIEIRTIQGPTPEKWKAPKDG